MTHAHYCLLLLVLALCTAARPGAHNDVGSMKSCVEQAILCNASAAPPAIASFKRGQNFEAPVCYLFSLIA